MFVLYLLAAFAFARAEARDRLPARPDNFVVGRPFIGCHPNGISLNVRIHTSPFMGLIYARNAKAHPKCHRTYSRVSNETDIQLNIHVENLVECGFQIVPKPNDKSTTVINGQIIVTFHETRVTPFDQIYAVHCEFDTFSLQSQLVRINRKNVMLKRIEAKFSQMPSVSMRIETKNNRAARIGEPMKIVWQLNNSTNGIYGFEVTRCTAQSKSGDEKFELIKNGCSKDGELISNVVMASRDHTKMTAIASAFKFASSKDALRINCSMRICLRRLPTMVDNVHLCKTPTC